MRVSKTVPARQLFVCANRREGSPLGPGCSSWGDALYDALKREVAARGLVQSVWITKTHCLGICPKRGATVARYGSGVSAVPPIVTECEAADAAELLDARGEESPASAELERELEQEIEALIELQTRKVLDLARRLKPGLTLEDVQNPHDFPELDDPDWHYADGVLTGMTSVRTALAALRKRREPT